MKRILWVIVPLLLCIAAFVALQRQRSDEERSDATIRHQTATSETSPPGKSTTRDPGKVSPPDIALQSTPQSGDTLLTSPSADASGQKPPVQPTAGLALNRSSIPTEEMRPSPARLPSGDNLRIQDAGDRPTDATRIPPLREHRADGVVPGKLVVNPLPPPREIENTVWERRIQELEQAIAEESDPRVRERSTLVLAGYHVGLNNWASATELYEKLAAETDNPLVATAARRNLEVARKTLAVQSEADPGQQERLKLELADLHRDMGHYKASRAFYRELAADAQNSELKRIAAERLTTQTEPTRPPMPVDLTE